MSVEVYHLEAACVEDVDSRGSGALVGPRGLAMRWVDVVTRTLRLSVLGVSVGYGCLWGSSPLLLFLAYFSFRDG